MDLALHDKNVLITGGSKGIGKEIAKLFLKEGANVSIVGRNLETLEHTKQELNDQISIFQCNVIKENQRTKLISSYIEQKGKIDILINNAGGGAGSIIAETSLEEFHYCFELNYFSSVHLSKLAVTQMKKQKSGSIINLTSIYGRESGGTAPYNNSKAALISFTKSLANEVIKDGIRVNSVAPGSVYHDTGHWKERQSKDPDKIANFISNEIPAGRFGTAEEIANTVVYLASEKSSWIVGASLNVDGGQSKMNF